MRFASPILFAVCLLLGACAAPPAAAPVNTAPALLSYLGQARVPFDARFGGTVIGGLSAITYDPGRQVYYVLSDDRSARNPARFYTVRLQLSDDTSQQGIGDVTFTETHPLLDQQGRPFRPLDTAANPPVVPPDPEGIAFDAGRQRLYWSSEGERIIDGPVLLDPWVRTAGLDGGYLGQFSLPPDLAMSAQHTGPRRNRAMEGLTLTPDGRSVFAAMEDPGYNDGPESNGNQGVLTRITKFDVATGAPVAQYAYPMEPAASPADRNGVSDLVALSDTSFLVLERTDSAPPLVRIFRAEIGAATDVLALPSLVGAQVTPIGKTPAIDLSRALGMSGTSAPVDNLEGITLGPKLADGRQSVVLVSDNNFSSSQVTQFVLLAM